MDLFEFAESHQHRDAHRGEAAACDKAMRGASNMKARILACIVGAGEHGLTPDEYSVNTDALINTVRRRITDLWKDGLVRHHPEGLHRINDAENECIVWVAGRDPNGTMTRFEKDQKLIRDQVAEIERLVLRIKDLEDGLR